MARRATTTSAAAAKKTGAATSKKAAASKRNKGGETRGGGVGTSKAKAHNNSKTKENSKPPQSVVGSTRATRASKGKENGAVNATESKNTSGSGQKRRPPLGDISDRVHAESNVLSAKGKGGRASFKNSKSRKLNPDTVEKKNDFKKVRNVDENEKELLVDNISVEDRTADHDDDEDASKIGEEEEFSESEDEAADSEHEEYHEETKTSTKNNRKNSSKKKSSAASTKSKRVQRPVRGKSTPEETNGMAASAKTSKSTASSLKASKSRSSSRTVTTPTATARSSTRTRKNNQPTIYHDPSSSEGQDSDDEINDEESAYSTLENEHPNKRGKATDASKANTTDSTSATKTTITKTTPVPKEYQNVSGIVRKNTPKFEEEMSYANGGMDWRCFGAIDY